MGQPFKVGVTRDFLTAEGRLGFGDIGLGRLEAESTVEWEFLAESTTELRADQVGGYDALLLLGASLTDATLPSKPSGEPSRLAIVARFGVGFDNVDVNACTRADVVLTITPDGVRRPVASGVWTLVLALTHRLFTKDRLTREGRWHEKLDHMGGGLTGRTLGVLGFGNIGREVFRLGRPYEMRQIAYDPYASAEVAREAGVELVDLDTLLRTADFVVICCALTAETERLIGAEQLALMQPTAYLINVARGPIVDQHALTEALRERRIQGAGLDVFEKEPIDEADPLLELDNVILAPHALSWTDECFMKIGESACQSILDVARGRTPEHVVNSEVLESPGFLAKLRGYAERLEPAP